MLSTRRRKILFILVWEGRKSWKNPAAVLGRGVRGGDAAGVVSLAVCFSWQGPCRAPCTLPAGRLWVATSLAGYCGVACRCPLGRWWGMASSPWPCRPGYLGGLGSGPQPLVTLRGELGKTKSCFQAGRSLKSALSLDAGAS